MQNLRHNQPFLTIVCIVIGVMIAIVLRVLVPTVSEPSTVLAPPIQRPAVDTGLPLGSGRPERLAQIRDCLPAIGTPNAGFYSGDLTDVSSTLDIDPNYQPPEVKERVHPTNFGRRFTKDAKGKIVDNPLLVVLHETVGDARGAVNTLQVSHPKDQDQVSYHAVITRAGKVINLVDPKHRAYGAGNSEFTGINGPEAVLTNTKLLSSVNNFAYHISLETPKDGLLNDIDTHSGYTDEQYRSLAWLVARTGVATSRITTHEAVDRFQARQDPRSFSYPKLLRYLNAYPRSEDVKFCPGSAQS
jgi:N-acetyl-anhydromuramyl-L-alanine amidase AmpD